MNAQDIKNLEQSILNGGDDLADFAKSSPLKTAEEIRRDWLLERVGKFTASQFYRLTTAPTKEVLPVGAITYTTEKAVEELTEVLDDGYISPAMQHGLDNEVKAIEAFELETGFKVSATGINQKFLRMGASMGGSPDGLIKSSSGVEVKCPNSLTHFKYLKIKDSQSLKKINTEYYWQIQGLMMITGCDHWYFISYDPRFKNDSHKIHYAEIRRNQDDIDFLKLRMKMAIELKAELLKDFITANDKPLNQCQVLKVLGIGRTKLWTLRKSGNFPKPCTDIPLRWHSNEIDNYIMEK